MRTLRPIRSRIVAAAFTVFLASACGLESDGARSAEETLSEACPALAGGIVRFIVPHTAGGGYDVYARLLEPYLERGLGVEIVVENRSGAGGRVGARAIRDATPDGRTIGILNATSLMVSELAGNVTGLDPFEAFTVLGRIARSEAVLATVVGGELETIGSVVARSHEMPILVGMTDVGSVSFASVSVVSELLEMEVRYLAGYPGSREASLGLIRGEYDLGGFTLESVWDRVTSGDLRPVLQIASAPLLEDPLLADVPVLGGPAGIAARAAHARGEDPTRSVALAEALIGMYDAGRIVVAPPDLPDDLVACLSEALAGIAVREEFLAAAALAGRSIAFEAPKSLTQTVAATRADRRTLTPIFRRHIELARGGSGG